MAVFAENGSFRPKNCYGDSFLKAISYGFGVSEKIPFRSHTKNLRSLISVAVHFICSKVRVLAPPGRGGELTQPSLHILSEYCINITSLS